MRLLVGAMSEEGKQSPEVAPRSCPWSARRDHQLPWNVVQAHESDGISLLTSRNGVHLAGLNFIKAPLPEERASAGGMFCVTGSGDGGPGWRVSPLVHNPLSSEEDPAFQGAHILAA